MKSLSTLAVAILTLSVTLSGAGSALAQLSPNSSAPVDVVADEMELANSQCTSIWRGSAEAQQDTARLRADVLTTRFQPKPGGNGPASNSCGALVGVEAQGSVYYVTPEQRVRADRAVYDATAETIVMTGDVIAVQGQNVLRGTRMVFNTQTGEGRMEGSATGRNASGRVRGVFYPDRQEKAGGAAR